MHQRQVATAGRVTHCGDGFASALQLRLAEQLEDFDQLSGGSPQVIRKNRELDGTRPLSVVPVGIQGDEIAVESVTASRAADWTLPKFRSDRVTQQLDDQLPTEYPTPFHLQKETL